MAQLLKLHKPKDLSPYFFSQRRARRIAVNMEKDLKTKISMILAPAIGEALELMLEHRPSSATPVINSGEPGSKQRPDEYLTVAEAARFLRVHPRTIYELVYQNRIPYHKVGDRILFMRTSLIEWTASQAEIDRSRRLRVVKS
jgi:excisionase family DNA binding protein